MPSNLPPNIACVVAYLCMPITSGVLLLLEKENKEVLFHAWQATLFSGGLIAVMIVTSLLSGVPFLGVLFGIALYLEFMLGLAGMVVGLVKTYQGEHWKMPYLGDMAERKAGLTA